LGIGLALSALTGCDDDTDTGPIIVDGRILIQDRTGKLWDITYAVNELQMSADQFNYGLRPDAIPPIIDPQFSLPGDDDYPLDDALFLVLGVTVAGEHRAYRIAQLSSHEVVDDIAGETAFAATY
jgi:hypothetical protein